MTMTTIGGAKHRSPEEQVYVDRGGGLSTAVRSNADGFAKVLRLAWQGGAHTPLDRPIGPHRRFDWTVVSLADAKAVKARLGGTLNDVVLAVVSGALGAFLRRRRVLGSRMVPAYPLVTLLANQAFGIAVSSYDGRLHFGFNADWDLVPDLPEAASA